MLSKSNVKSFVIGSACTAVLATSVVGFASGGVTKTIEAFYNNVKLVVDGRPVSLGNDLSGNKIEPFIYKGTTYLPVRAVGEALNKKVDWDGETQTVYIGEIPGQSAGEGRYITEVLEGVMTNGKTFSLKDKEKLTMGGKTYNTGFRTHRNDMFIYFNLDSQYKQVEGDIGAAVAVNETMDVNILLDGKIHDTVTVSGNKASQKFTIPVSGVNELRFQVVDRFTPIFGNINTVQDLLFSLGDVKIK